jgi:hypothetical protein
METLLAEEVEEAAEVEVEAEEEIVSIYRV